MNKLSIKHEIRLFVKTFRYLRKSQNKWLRDAKEQIALLDGLNEEEKERLFLSYKKDYSKYRMKFSEFYYSYLFTKIPEEKQKEYLSQRDIVLLGMKYSDLYPDQARITANKQVFLEKFKPFVHRTWIYIDKTTKANEVQELLDRFDVIVKPTNASSGHGVFKIKKGTGNGEMLLKRDLPLLAEQCVYNVKELAEFHPASLNTVRITTITNGKEVKILGACLRTGNNNSVFDNADSGGFFAEIDADTGEIISDGIDERGKQVIAHPVSGKVFRGTMIPNWGDVLAFCFKAALHLKDTHLIAWDIAITTNGIELIEGNSVPSLEVHQMPLHMGIRKKLYSIMDELRLPYKDIVFFTKICSWLLSLNK